MMIGLTKLFWQKHAELVAELAEMGIHTLEQAEEFGLEESKLIRLRLAINVVNNPEINLWNHEARMMHGLPF